MLAYFRPPILLTLLATTLAGLSSAHTPVTSPTESTWPADHGLSQSAPSLEQLTLTEGMALEGVGVHAPSSVTMGDAFYLRLTGPNAAHVTVRFLSELGQDVRAAAEVLEPVPSELVTGEYLVLGKVTLGMSGAMVYEVRLGEQLIRRQIAIAQPKWPVQQLNLGNTLSKLRQDPNRQLEKATLEENYTLRSAKKWSKPFALPINNRARRTSGFGQPRRYGTATTLSYHYGSDFAARSGTPILAINDGQVVTSAKFPMSGNMVVIDHGLGLLSLYFHLSRRNVTVGQMVKRGQQIGRLGSTGLSSGPHLHLEMRLRGEAVNPSGWLNRLWPR